MKTKRSGAMPLYCAIQVLYWVNYCLMFIFVSKFLQGRGFSDSQIGICMGLTYALTAVTAPLLASLFQSRHIALNRGMAGTYAVVLAVSVLQLFLRRGKLITGVLLVAVLTLQGALQASMNSLHRLRNENGDQLNFSIARGLGSLFYAGTAYLAGQLLTTMPSDRLPLLYIITLIPLLICLWLFATPAPAAAENGGDSMLSVLRVNPAFPIFLGGVLLLAYAHSYTDSYLLQVFQALGGDTGEQGIAVAVAAITELPAMMLYARIAKRTGAKPMLILAGWAWVVKMTVIFLARTSGAVIASMLLQFLSFAVYTPASVDYITERFDRAHQLKAQALLCSTYTAGSFLSALISGRLNETIGIRSTLAVLACAALMGAALITVSLLKEGRKHAVNNRL